MTHLSFASSFKNNKRWHILLLIILPLILYIQVVHFDYTNFDDNKIIKNNFATISNIKNIKAVIIEDAFFKQHGSFYRPVQNISFMLDAQISGKKLWMFHLTNLVLHILCCIALYYFLQILLFEKFTAFCMALLFAVHPLFASDIGWLPARSDLLIGLEGLLLFISFHNYFKQYKSKWFLLHTFLFLLIVFTKETAIVFPILLLFYYFLLLNKPPHFNTKKTELKKLSPFFLIWFVVSVLYLYIRKKVTVGIDNNETTGIYSFLENVLAIPTIIGKFFVPVHLSTLPIFDTASVITGFIFSGVILFYVFKYSLQTKWIVLFGLLWFLSFAIPPTIYRLHNAGVFFNYLEHRSYLPMIGILMLVGFVVNDQFRKSFLQQSFIRVFVPVIVILGTLAYLHCADYKNTLTVADCAAKRNNPSAFAARAGYRLSIGDTSGTIADCRQAIVLMKNSPIPAVYNNLGEAYTGLNMPDSAFANFNKAIELDTNFAFGYFERGKAKLKFGDTTGACIDWKQAAKLGYIDTTDMVTKYSEKKTL